MEENFDGQNQPRTYGEESKLYENAQTGYNQSYGQPGGQPNYNQPNYNQSYGQPGGQPNYNQSYGQPEGQPNYNQPNYNQPYYNQPNYNQPNYNQPYNGGYYGAKPHGPVKDVFCYILLVIMPLRIIVSWFLTGSLLTSMDYEHLMNDAYMETSTGYMAMSLFSTLLGIAFLVFVILDIVMIYRQNYKIVGLILFAIFLSPGYYIWRAYILQRKKTIPIIYTVAYTLLVVANWIFTFSSVFQTVFRTLQMMN